MSSSYTNPQSAINGFANDTAAKEWDKHWPEISKAKSLILDLRENGGGSDSVGYHILSTLIIPQRDDRFHSRGAARW